MQFEIKEARHLAGGPSSRYYLLVWFYANDGDLAPDLVEEFIMDLWDEETLANGRTQKRDVAGTVLGNIRARWQLAVAKGHRGDHTHRGRGAPDWVRDDTDPEAILSRADLLALRTGRKA
jgi:hypothetical protein